LASCILATSVFFAGCNPDNPLKSVPDPIGTLTANISRETGISISGVGGIYWTSPDNFSLGTGYYYNRVSICNMGVMSGLGNITKIPASGFTTPADYLYSAACEARRGYVIKFESFNSNYLDVYVRLYVVEKIVSTSGGIMGAKVKYQYPFEP